MQHVRQRYQQMLPPTGGQAGLLFYGVMRNAPNVANASMCTPWSHRRAAMKRSSQALTAGPKTPDVMTAPALCNPFCLPRTKSLTVGRRYLYALQIATTRAAGLMNRQGDPVCPGPNNCSREEIRVEDQHRQNRDQGQHDSLIRVHGIPQIHRTSEKTPQRQGHDLSPTKLTLLTELPKARALDIRAHLDRPRTRQRKCCAQEQHRRTRQPPGNRRDPKTSGHQLTGAQDQPPQPYWPQPQRSDRLPEALS